jgi:hypothetical protein
LLEQRDELLAAVADNASDSVIVMKSREDPIRKTVSEIMETRDRERGLNRPLTPELISITIEILRYSIFNGMDSTMFVSFDVSDSALFRNEQPFGNAVWNVFPSAIDDSIEAGKCIALERYTAAVFHLMRVLEAGLKALAKALGAPYSENWGQCLGDIEKRAMDKHSNPAHKQAVAYLAAVKNAWRKSNHAH